MRGVTLHDGESPESDRWALRHVVAASIGGGIGFSVLAVNYERAGLEDTELWWVAPTAMMVGVAVGLAVDWLATRRLTPGVVPMAIVSTLVATYLCVPETDQFRMASIAPIAVLVVEVVTRRRLPAVCYGVAAVAIGWAGMFGASGRPSAFVGALFAWWALILAPLVSLAVPMRDRVAITIVAGTGSVAAVVASRTGGIAVSGRAAVFAVGVVAVISGAVGIVVARRASGSAKADSAEGVIARRQRPTR